MPTKARDLFVLILVGMLVSPVFAPPRGDRPERPSRSDEAAEESELPPREGWKKLEGEWLDPETYEQRRKERAERIEGELVERFRTTFEVVPMEAYDVAFEDPNPRSVEWVTGQLRWFHETQYEEHFWMTIDRPYLVVYFANQQTYGNSGRGLGMGNYRHHERTLYTYAGSGIGTVFHEIMHGYIRDHFPAVPRPFNEGFASFFEGCNWADASRTTLRFGLHNHRVPLAQQMLQQGGMKPLGEFIAGNDYPQVTQTYAHGRALASWLWSRRELGPFMKAYLRARGENAPRILEELTGMPIDEIDAAVREFIGNARLNTWIERVPEEPKPQSEPGENEPDNGEE